MNHKKELLRSLWVGLRALASGNGRVSGSGLRARRAYKILGFRFRRACKILGFRV